MILGTQYYRPPFPDTRYWEEDFARIKACGLNTVQLWVVWGWVEAKPDVFTFDDYDRLVELAEKNDLQVVLSTIAAIHPYWIHRVVPDSEMITRDGHRVISSSRQEVHNGLTPGGCFDHPGVWERMAGFLTQVVERYRDAAPLVGWDAWNEIRWNVQADGAVCYCPHTLAAFRRWLDGKYGGLDALNDAWKRRYGDWDEVMPGKAHNRPYTEMMAFLHFLTERTNGHARARYDLMKALDPGRPVTVHGAFPCADWPGTSDNHVLNRGNDWDFADHLDGVGCSSFPKWSGIDDADFGIRVEMVKSAGRDKLVWLSEVQGGRASLGFEVYEPVDPASQQRWIWNGFAGGASAVLFWCWRDEVFTSESGGFGLIGQDGFAEQRLAAMRQTADVLDRHAATLADYAPAKPEVGVLFSPDSYRLCWSQEGHASRSVNAMLGYTRALVRKSIPFLVVEDHHLDVLDDLKVLFLPRILVTDAPLEEALTRFVERGGTLVCESETGAFGSNGLYRYPVDRFTAQLTGLAEVGRRSLPSDRVRVALEGFSEEMALTQWVTPWERGAAPAWCDHADGALIQRVPVGHGQVVLCGAYLGEAYRTDFTTGFEAFVDLLARQGGWTPGIEVVAPLPDAERFVYVKHGQAGGRPVIFVFAPDGVDSVRLRLREGLVGSGSLHDLITGTRAPIVDGTVCDIPLGPWRLAVLAEE